MHVPKARFYTFLFFFFFRVQTTRVISFVLNQRAPLLLRFPRTSSASKEINLRGRVITAAAVSAFFYNRPRNSPSCVVLLLLCPLLVHHYLCKFGEAEGEKLCLYYFGQRFTCHFQFITRRRRRRRRRKDTFPRRVLSGGRAGIIIFLLLLLL